MDLQNFDGAFPSCGCVFTILRSFASRDVDLLLISSNSSSMAATVHPEQSTHIGDWAGRYYHVDQVLDRPGPRTDPSFLAGDGVCDRVMV